MLGTPQPKPRPHALVKRQQQAKLKARDEAASRKVRKRSGGRCEAREVTRFGLAQGRSRCHRWAVGEPHHLIYGSGRRNVGRSILAQWKLAVCRECHREIQQHILVPLDPQADALQVIYRRIR